MDTVIEDKPAPPPLKPYQINRDNARDMARKANEAKARYAEEKETILNALIAREPLMLALQRPDCSPNAYPLPKRLELLDTEIVRTHEVLSDNDLEAKDRAQLVNSLCKLLDTERMLRGIPAPAPFKAERPRTRRESYDIQPIDVAPKAKTYDGPETG